MLRGSGIANSQTSNCSSGGSSLNFGNVEAFELDGDMVVG